MRPSYVNPLSEIGFPQDFIAEVFDKFQLKHDAEFVPVTAMPTATEMLGGLVVCLGKDGSFSVVTSYAGSQLGLR